MIELMDLIGGGTPKTSKAEYWSGNIPWLSVKDFNDDRRYVFTTEKTITQMGLDNSSTKLLNAGDIVISARGTVGELAIIPFPMAFNQSCYGIRAKQDIVDSTYLYYLMKHNVRILQCNTHGSVFDTITRDTFANIDVSIPNVDIQRKVATILSLLDEKIEINNAINENLEQQIQNIFHNIFPNIFKGSLDTLESIILFSNGKKRPEEIGTIPVYGGNGILTYTRDSNSENCVIIGRVGAYCGNTYLCSGKCWVSDNAIQAKSKNSNSQLFIYYCLKNASLPFKHIGSGQPLMTQGILNSIQCVIPDEIEVEQFIIHCTPMQQCIDSNIEENDRLSKLRDTLLPKLMSGEIDVSNITI